MKMKNQPWKLYCLAFLVPAALMLCIWACTGIHPFGDKSLLTIDMNNQYISFYNWFCSVLHGDGSFFYSFSRTMGGNMVGLTAYYLLSPFNLILLFFDTATLPNAVFIITLLKIGCCGLTMSVFLSSRKRSWGILLFSNAYALMAYNLIYQNNLMWLDGVIMLPLVLLGIERIIRKKSSLFYMLTLIAAIITNYYIGYMICIFSVLYFLYTSVCAHSRIKEWFACALRFGIASLLSGGIIGIFLVPVFRSLQGGKAYFSLSLLTLKNTFHWSDFFLKLFPGSVNPEQYQTGLPNVFCGVAILIFAVLFFLASNIRRRKKLAALVTCLVLFASFYFDGFQLVWHAMNYTNWFPYRFSFVFSAFLIILAWEGYEAVKGGGLPRLSFLCIPIGAALLLITLWALYKRASFLKPSNILLFLICGAGVLLLLLIRQYGLLEKGFLPLMMLIGAAELFANGIWTLDVFTYADYGNYQAFVKENKPVFAQYKAPDGEFYRMEKTYYRRNTDPMLLSYDGISHFSSTELDMVKSFIDRLGLRASPFWCNYNQGSTSAVDSFLGIRYILSKKKLEEPYRPVGTHGEITVYENPYTLPLGFLADEAVDACVLDHGDRFSLQEQLWQALAPEVKGRLFHKLKVPKPRLKNLTAISEKDGIRYKKKKEDKPAAAVYTCTATEDAPVYLYIPAFESHKAKVLVNGELISQYFTVYDYNILRLGDFKKGEQVQIKLRPYENELCIQDLWLYSEDTSLLETYYETLKPGFLQTENIRDGHIEGTVTAEEGKNTLVFTVPYDNGWRASIDGGSVPLEYAYSTLLAIQVPEGTHHIELKYIPVGFKMGGLISFVSLLAGAGFLYYERRRVIGAA